ncbi:MAG: hypothetical protein HYZ29_08575 [Myxococcales bacterium]|nr:hypothetical protein [Myxococcales bacterium]
MNHQPPTPVCASAARVLESLTQGLEVGDLHFLDDPAEVHMPLMIERSADSSVGVVFSVGQYHPAAGGGRVWDPRVVFLRTTAGGWVPLSYEDAFSVSVFAEPGETVRVLSPAQRDLARLCDHWMRHVDAAHTPGAPGFSGDGGSRNGRRSARPARSDEHG